MKLAKLISYIFHPILIPIIGTLLYFILLPTHTSSTLEITVILYVFFGTYILPLIFLSALKHTKSIKSFQLQSIEERKNPILLLLFVTSLLAVIFKNGGVITDLTLFFFGSSLSLTATYLLLHKNLKISLHLTGIGGLIGFILFFSYEYALNNLLVLAFLFILSGFIAYSRLKLKAHTTKEIYLGFALGLTCQLLIYSYNI